MRFKGTWLLMILCLALGVFIYFYEIKGGQERDKAKEAETRLWMIEGKDIKKIELHPPTGEITAVRTSDTEWSIQSPRPLEADSEELNRLADKAAELKYDSVLEESASDAAQFGLEPARSSVTITTVDDKKHTLFIGDQNPSGNRTYARVSDRNELFLMSSSLPETFDKKLDDLRNHSVLRFGQSEVHTLDITNPKGTLHLVKDASDRWWIEGKHRVAADSPAVRGILNALSLGKIPEFFDESPEKYPNLGLKKPRFEVSLTYGNNNAIKHLSIGAEKSALPAKEVEEKPAADSAIYLAKDASRPELFFVKQDLVDKLNTSAGELRDKAIASFQRWDVDSITMENPHGQFALTKEGGEWFIGGDKKRADFDTVSGILDALESKSTGLIDNPGAMADYGLDKPTVHVVLKQGDKILADCSFGEKTKDKIYARLAGDPAVKAVDPENYNKLLKDEADLTEKKPSPEPASKATEP
jgi:hypothetical protein